MQYHEPCILWDTTEIPDFNAYCDKFVVKGLFHRRVPKDVVEAFETAEYLMAHAYYYWPLYDEAFAKLLLIFELAVKLRCTHFGIPIKERKNKSSLKNRHLEKLILDVCRQEPSKNIEAQLHWLRNRRNDVMHPNSHTYSGIIANFDAIRHGVGILNKLFAPEHLFTEVLAKIESVNDQLRTLSDRPLVLDIGNRFLVEDVKVEDALLVDGEWYYFIVAAPISHNIGEQVRQHYYIDPQTAHVKNIRVDDNKVTMADVLTGNPIYVSISQHPIDLETYRKFKEERDDAKDNQEGTQIIQISSNFGRQQIDFCYLHSWKLCTNFIPTNSTIV